MSDNGDIIQIERMSVDQFAGSVVLILGAVGSLLLVIWQSRCACRCRIGCSDKCYIFDCSREPPTQEQLDNLKEEAENKKKDRTSKRGSMSIAEGNNDLKKSEKEEDKNKLWGQVEGEEPESIQSPRESLIPQTSQPEPEIDKLI